MSILAYRLISLPPRLAYAVGLGPIMGRLVLLLTTRGRRSGKPRVTPLQYEMIGDDVVVASVRGTEADWYRNLVADPSVRVRVGGRRFDGIAETATDPELVADFIELRLRRRPRSIGRILRAAGVPASPSRSQLVEYASGRALARIRPVAGGSSTQPAEREETGGPDRSAASGDGAR